MSCLGHLLQQNKDVNLLNKQANKQTGNGTKGHSQPVQELGIGEEEVGWGIPGQEEGDRGCSQVGCHRAGDGA